MAPTPPYIHTQEGEAGSLRRPTSPTNVAIEPQILRAAVVLPVGRHQDRLPGAHQCHHRYRRQHQV